jgi:transcriptional regulator with XRE-family HTH domain
MDTTAPLSCFDNAKLARLRREWCDRHDASTEHFADRVPISYPYLMRLESGPNTPSMEMLRKLAATLGIHPGELLTIAPEEAEPTAVAS